MTTLGRSQRFNRGHPCPICGGHPELPHGKGVRCAGFRSSDGGFAHCTREQLAGNLRPTDAVPPTYPHRLHGECGCGVSHGPTRPTHATDRRHEHRSWADDRDVAGGAGADHLVDQGHAGREAPSKALRRQLTRPRMRAFEYRTLDGTLVAVHRRIDQCPDAGNPSGKRMWWESPDGSAGLDGLNVAELPLYRTETLGSLQPGTTVVLVEGEVAADALTHIGIPAVATGCGASTIPGDTVLSVLRGFEVPVWPDNDDAGRDHVRRVGDALIRLGVRVPGVVAWEEYFTGDAADLVLDHVTNGTVDTVAAQATVTGLITASVAVDRLSDPLRTYEASGPVIRVVSAATVKVQSVLWAWERRVPVGMVTLLVGTGGLGKSTLLCEWAARWSRGDLEGDLQGQPRSVVIASSEDHRGAVVVPRLIAAGADLGRVGFVEYVTGDTAADIELGGQMAELETALAAAEATVLIIDTLVSHIPSRHDSYKEQHVRRVLAPMAHMAERNCIALVATMHLNRRETRSVLDRISGSGGFGNLARSVLLLADEPGDDDSDTRLLAHAKCNVGALAETLRLRIEGCSVTAADGAQMTASRVNIIEQVPGVAANQLLVQPLNAEERSQLDHAMAFVAEVLRSGALPSVELQKQAKAEAISPMTLRRACERLMAVRRKDGMSGGWWVSLPPEGDHPGPKVIMSDDERLRLGAEQLRGTSDPDATPDAGDGSSWRDPRPRRTEFDF